MGMFRKDPWKIITFNTYGTDAHLYLRGRAIEDEGIDLSKSGFFQLLRNSFKRFETDEIAYKELIVTLSNNVTFTTKTDKRGYYLLDIQMSGLSSLMNERGWITYTIAFKNILPKQRISSNNVFQGKMLIPQLSSEFGVISDIDDTILYTGVVSKFKWRLLVNTLFKKASRRTPLEGAVHFCDQLSKGSDGKQTNPIYYVSHSPWNLYRYLDHFLTLNKFPEAPILLRSLSSIFKKRKGEKPQKQREIEQLLETYLLQSFILIGDGGENDADIYLEIAETYPGRIKAIYLRSVPHEKRMLRIKKLLKGYNAIPVLLMSSSKEGLLHAKEHGFIH